MKKHASSAKLGLLHAILPHIPFDGWTDAAFARAAKQCGLSEGEAGLLFPRGIRDVIELFGESADDAMLARIKKERGFKKFRTRDKIAFAMRARLEYLTPHREAVRRMMAWYALPGHWRLGAARIYRVVDLAWRAAGDTSTDFNFYTKRGLLAGVLKATMLFWFDDGSEGCSASWAFLDRRIGEVLRLGQALGKFKPFQKRATGT